MLTDRLLRVHSARSERSIKGPVGSQFDEVRADTLKETLRVEGTDRPAEKHRTVRARRDEDGRRRFPRKRHGRQTRRAEARLGRPVRRQRQCERVELRGLLIPVLDRDVAADQHAAVSRERERVARDPRSTKARVELPPRGGSACGQVGLAADDGRRLREGRRNVDRTRHVGWRRRSTANRFHGFPANTLPRTRARGRPAPRVESPPISNSQPMVGDERPVHAGAKG